MSGVVHRAHALIMPSSCGLERLSRKRMWAHTILIRKRQGIKVYVLVEPFSAKRLRTNLAEISPSPPSNQSNRTMSKTTFNGKHSTASSTYRTKLFILAELILLYGTHLLLYIHPRYQYLPLANAGRIRYIAPIYFILQVVKINAQTKY